MIPSLSPVEYRIHHYSSASALTLSPGKAYGYVLAGNGLWKVASSRHIEARFPLANTPVAGLLPIHGAYIRLLAGRVPGRMLETVLTDARLRAQASPVEAMYHFYLRGGQIRIARPPQVATATRVAYQGGDDPDIFLDLHSHHIMPAFWSGTDNRDEGGFRLCAVIGRVFERPEIRLRLACYGDFYDLPARTIFTDTGPFSDAMEGDHVETVD